jgi:hypothetical protein
MNNKFLFANLLSLIICFLIVMDEPICAQQTATPTPQQTTQTSVAEANQSDVASLDAIIKSVYEEITRDAGVKRDWNRFRSLFYPGARLIPTGKNREGKVGGRVITPDEYVERSGPFLEKEGFHEREIARRTEIYGNIAHVFSTYDSKHKVSDEKPFARGINSIQVLNDGKRWWILTIAWSSETPDSPIPAKYLKSGNN